MFYQYENEDHERKAKEVLAGLGEFVIAFERVCAGMRSCIHCAFHREGLKNQALSQAFVNPLAAEGLRTALGGVFMELRDQDEDDKKTVSRLLKRIDDLAQTRNKLLHAEWFLNYNYEGADEEFFALALKPHLKQSKGVTFIESDVSRRVLDEHLREATEILVLVSRLATALNQGGLKVSEYLSKPL